VTFQSQENIRPKPEGYQRSITDLLRELLPTFDVKEGEKIKLKVSGESKENFNSSRRRKK